MTNEQMLNKAKDVVVDYFNRYQLEKHRKEAGYKLTRENIFIVWFSKTIRNWKALVITDERDGYYYEVTYDGFAGEVYVDVYKKVDKVIHKEIW